MITLASSDALSSCPTSPSHCDIEFSEFIPLSEESVRRITASSTKTWAIDPRPSSALTFCLDELHPVITKIVNLSRESGVFADDWKNASVHPFLNKAGLQLISENLLPVSNLQFTSKITEKSVALRMQDHMVVNGLLADLQSSYRQNHSTTALMKVKNGLLLSMD